MKNEDKQVSNTQTIKYSYATLTVVSSEDKIELLKEFMKDNDISFGIIK
jgi:hypothetical protein